MEVKRRGDEGFPRARGRVEDDVLLFEEFEDGRLLRGIELELARLGIVEEPPQQFIARRVSTARDQIVKHRSH